ncbi:glycosyltransferase family 4 protein [Uliginosibacterium sp. H1]|uniref:glycosyltransferase family 4 protein n=1 Tax=Uliginosibacterium sp. H1 TaxID=3114757 RepID=UPI002E19F97F|nr:glycosyltransferase family 4 protein [Uliginosibacterium sp. H1]
MNLPATGIRPLQVAAFTQGDDVPSARFRVRALIPLLAEEGIAVREWPARHGAYPPPGLIARVKWAPHALAERAVALREAGRSDVALFQRELLSTLHTIEDRWRGPAVFDVDDAIWLNQRFGGIDRIAQRLGRVICGNAYIAEHFSRHAKVWVLPTAVDTAHYRPAASLARDAGARVMVWSGSASGLPYLQDIVPALARIMASLPDVRLRVVCNQPPQLRGLPQERVDHWPWDPATEVTALQTAHLGLMPMPDTAWTRGKCSFKMLTYMACGLPVLVSPWGMNAEVLAHDEVGQGARDAGEWVDAAIALLRDDMLSRRLGDNGRRVVQQHYSAEVIVPRLAAILREAAA